MGPRDELKLVGTKFVAALRSACMHRARQWAGNACLLLPAASAVGMKITTIEVSPRTAR